ncbi:MAG: homoserine dehydrogenase [Endomicrobiia bacterium]|nr:homoserine dehydrogenase [Endomicrobiia bacterium]
MKKISIGIIGAGVVGGGVLEIFKKHSASIARRVGARVEISAVCDVSSRKVPARYRDVYVSDWRKIAADSGIDLVVELIGGYEPAATIILKSLASGKNVVTANKAVLAARWGDVFTAARRYSKLVYFEAAVGGAIPVVQALNEGLAANKITSISGILNGTSNYMLTAMHNDNISFASALKNAQLAGFAEADPSCDVKGIDTANKLAILTSIAAGAQVKLRDVSVEGIEDVSSVDVACLKNEFGRVIKLIGKTDIRPDGAIDITVRPRVISPSHPFGNVNWEYNAAMISGDSAGDLMFYGKGAGRLPAASAVVSDIIFLSRQIVSKTAGLMPYVEYDPSKKVKILDSSSRDGYYYLRFTVADKPGVLAKIAAALAFRGVSIASVYQNERPSQKSPSGAAVIIITHKAKESDLRSALDAIAGLRIVRKKTVVYPMEE